MASRTALFYCLIVVLTAGFFDQASKWIVLREVMVPPRMIPVTEFFNLVLVYNKGSSFGLFSTTGDAELRVIFLSALAMAIVVVMLTWLWREPSWKMTLSIGLIVGGAVSNVHDRWTRPGVVDFLDFHLYDYHWPAFNLADSFIFVGVTLLLIDGLFLGTKQAKRNE